MKTIKEVAGLLDVRTREPVPGIIFVVFLLVPPGIGEDG